MESLFEQPVHWSRLDVEAGAACWIGIGPARTANVFPAGAQPAQA